MKIIPNFFFFLISESSEALKNKKPKLGGNENNELRRSHDLTFLLLPSEDDSVSFLPTVHTSSERSIHEEFPSLISELDEDGGSSDVDDSCGR